MKRVALMVILLLVMPLICPAGTLVAKAAGEAVLDPPVEKGFWQYGVDSGQGTIRLAIRDKLGHVGGYRAVFVVTAPDRRAYNSEKNGSGTSEVSTAFPYDFGATWMKGVYTWTCTISGRTIAQGSFQYCKWCQIRLLDTSFVPMRSAGR